MKVYALTYIRLSDIFSADFIEVLYLDDLPWSFGDTAYSLVSVTDLNDYVGEYIEAHEEGVFASPDASAWWELVSTRISHAHTPGEMAMVAVDYPLIALGV